MHKLVLASAALALLATPAFAADKTVPLAGKVIELTPTKITTQDAKNHRFEFARDSATPAPANLKVGDSVVIQTKLVAMAIAALPPKGTAKAPASATKTKKKAK